MRRDARGVCPVPGLGGRLRPVADHRQGGVRGRRRRRADAGRALRGRRRPALALVPGPAAAACASAPSAPGWSWAPRLYAPQSGLYFGAIARMDAGLAALVVYAYPAMVAAGRGRAGPRAPERPDGGGPRRVVGRGGRWSCSGAGRRPSTPSGSRSRSARRPGYGAYVLDLRRRRARRGPARPGRPGHHRGGRRLRRRRAGRRRPADRPGLRRLGLGRWRSPWCPRCSRSPSSWRRSGASGRRRPACSPPSSRSWPRRPRWSPSGSAWAPAQVLGALLVLSAVAILEVPLRRRRAARPEPVPA